MNNEPNSIFKNNIKEESTSELGKEKTEEEKKQSDYATESDASVLDGEISSHMVARWYRPPEIILISQFYE